VKDALNSLVSIVIVTIGIKNYLWSCLDSIKAQSYPNLEVIVINNSSEPGFSFKISAYSDSIKVYTSSQNLFYSASLNKGIELSQGKFVLCLNDDVILDKEFISEALKGFSVRDNIGMVSGKILRQDKLTLDSTGLFLSVFRFAKERGYGKLDSGQFEKSGFIYGVNGAVAFYRKLMLEEIKDGEDYFDSRFRMFYEDLDISWRANNRGWFGYYIPQARAYHVRGGSFRPDSGLGKVAARRYLNDQLHASLIKNRYRTILKNENFFSLLLHIIPIILYDLGAWAYVLLFRPKVIKYFPSA
jgi:GT2 family glycosyltransferase